MFNSYKYVNVENTTRHLECKPLTMLTRTSFPSKFPT